MPVREAGNNMRRIADECNAKAPCSLSGEFVGCPASFACAHKELAAAAPNAFAEEANELVHCCSQPQDFQQETAGSTLWIALVKTRYSEWKQSCTTLHPQWLQYAK